MWYGYDLKYVQRSFYPSYESPLTWKCVFYFFIKRFSIKYYLVYLFHGGVATSKKEPVGHTLHFSLCKMHLCFNQNVLIIINLFGSVSMII